MWGTGGCKIDLATMSTSVRLIPHGKSLLDPKLADYNYS